MSRPMTEEEYNKRLFNRVKRWVMGEADPYLGRVEIKEQKENTLSPEVLEQHKKDRELTLKEVHDTEKNKIYRKFFRFYRIAAVLCCVALIAMLLVAVSYLPPVGNADNPAHNEVVAKYIEDGMQDTGAVNIVTGMILDYRAFDTFGESNVLFIATCTVLILLRNDKKNEKKKAEWEAQKDSLYEPGADSIDRKSVV